MTSPNRRLTMKDNQAKYPQLRFKGFTDPWEQRKLEKVFDTITDYVANGSFESLRKNVNSSDINGFAYLVRLQDASNNWQGPWLYTDQHGYEFLKKSRLQPDDIIMANVGSVGKFFLVPRLDKPMTLAPNAVLIKSSENDQVFLYQMMLTPEMQYKIFEKTTPGVQSKINKTDFKMIETRLPNMDEQEKIGAFFKQLDDTIALHQRKLDLLKEQKKGYLQKMFPKNGAKVPELRFAGFADAWEQRKLGELFKPSRNKNNNDLYNQKDILAASLGTELIPKRTFFGLKSTKESVKNYRVVKHGDLIYTKSPIKGFPNGIVRTNKGNVGIVPSLYCVYQAQKEINTSIIQLYFEDKNRLNFYLFPLVNVGARNNVNITDLEFLEGIIKVPKSIEEQKKIVDFIEHFNKAITLHQRKLDLLKEQKKGFLQNMFV